jgi:hypothetical protein
MYHYIYALVCPKDNTIRYIGKSINPETRFLDHIGYKDKSNIRKNRWIKKLKEEGSYPVLKILDKRTSDKIDDLERFFIS